MGVRVTRVTAYRTTPAALSPEAQEQLRTAPPDVVLFASPRTVEVFLEAAGRERLEQARVVAIGPTTAGALVRLGIEVAAVAERPTPEGLVEAAAAPFTEAGGTMGSLRLLGPLLVLGLPALVWGSGLPPQTLAELAGASERIVLARVVRSARQCAKWQRQTDDHHLPVGGAGGVSWAGARALELVQLGGRSGLWESHLAGACQARRGGDWRRSFLPLPWIPRAAERCALARAERREAHGDGGRSGARRR